MGFINNTIGDWTPIESCNDYKTVKAIAVEIVPANGSPIAKEDVITVNIKMQSNNDYQYNGLFNRVNFGCVSVTESGTTKSSSTSDYVVIKQLGPTITYIKRIKADSVNMANGVPTFIVEYSNGTIGTSFVFSFDEGYDIVEIDGVEYYELSHEITTELNFGEYISVEKDSLRYGKPSLEIAVEDGTVNSDNTVSFETSFSNPEVTIISTSEKVVYRGFSHNAICVNEFDNDVAI
jgi:hypothetical protein